VCCWPSDPRCCKIWIKRPLKKPGERLLWAREAITEVDTVARLLRVCVGVVVEVVLYVCGLMIDEHTPSIESSVIRVAETTEAQRMGRKGEKAWLHAPPCHCNRLFVHRVTN